VLMGAMSKWAFKRIADFCDGWIPLDGAFDLARGLAALREEMNRVGRAMTELDLTVITGYALAGATGSERRIRELMELGFNRILFLLEAGAPEAQWPVLEQYAGLIRQFR